MRKVEKGDSMSILVIGGMGFIGSRIVRSLVELGEEVVVVGRQPTLHRLGEVAEKVKVIQGDKTSIDQIFDWISTYKVSKIIDASSELEAESEKVPYSATKTNLIGTLNVFEAARISGIKRVVWASSLAVYGDKKRAGGIPQNEDALNHPVTVYGACKTYGEFMTKLYNARWRTDIVALRPSSVYGPLRARGLTSWLTDVVKLPLTGQVVDIPVGPDETTNFCFVDDCAEAFVRCCQYEGDRLPHDIYYIGGFKASIKELMKEVKKHIPGAEARYEGKPLYYIDRIDNSRIGQDLGFKLKYDLAAGVKEQVSRQRALNKAELAV
ncbi:MAG: NAD-dependent epimerase/dehydratase family protein [Thermodesulfobacteriota bacterium]